MKISTINFMIILKLLNTLSIYSLLYFIFKKFSNKYYYFPYLKSNQIMVEYNFPFTNYVIVFLVRLTNTLKKFIFSKKIVDLKTN